MLEKIIRITKNGYKISDIGSYGEDAGVWFLIGRKPGENFKCLLIDRTNDIEVDISCCADLLSKPIKPVTKVFRNYYGEEIFTYVEHGNCKKNAMYNDIRTKYDDLYFICIKSEDIFIEKKLYRNTVAKGAVVRFIGLNTKCEYWIFGGVSGDKEYDEELTQKKKESCERNLKDAIKTLSTRADQKTMDNIKFFLDKLSDDDFKNFLDKLISSDKPEWIQKVDTSINMIDDIQIYEADNGVRYSIIPYSKSKTDDMYDYVVYKGIMAPCVYEAGTPRSVLKLRSALDPFLDDDGEIIEDMVIHCTKRHFRLLMQVDL